MSFLDIYAGDLGSAESPSDFSVHSDVLRTLNWNTGKVCDASLVRRMHLPALETAFLSFYERSEVPDDTVTAFLRHPMCNVHCLTLELLEVAILDGLQYTRRVTTLRFQDFTETSEAALQGLSGHTSETGGWLCPLLAHVTFPSYVDSEKFDIASLQEAILSFARARAPSAAMDTHTRKMLHSVNFEVHFQGTSFPDSFGNSINSIINPAAQVPVAG
ncbi:hypothetical protein AURDEDRAFT_163116 [Auricularia subglabra TFB-10046 SS5]|nr:hypothetical protein AURDEDRAFT_163116 [Auricularia subglabra TFB-10046 SS5]